MISVYRSRTLVLWEKTKSVSSKPRASLPCMAKRIARMARRAQLIFDAPLCARLCEERGDRERADNKSDKYARIGYHRDNGQDVPSPRSHTSRP